MERLSFSVILMGLMLIVGFIPVTAGGVTVGTGLSTGGGEVAADWSCDTTIGSLCLAAAAAATDTCITADAEAEAWWLFSADATVQVCGGLAAGGAAAGAHTLPADMHVTGTAGNGAHGADSLSQTNCLNNLGGVNGCSRTAVAGSDDLCVNGQGWAMGSNPVTSLPSTNPVNTGSMIVSVKAVSNGCDEALIRDIQKLIGGGNAASVSAENISMDVREALAAALYDEASTKLSEELSSWPVDEHPELKALRDALEKKVDEALQATIQENILDGDGTLLVMNSHEANALTP